MMTIFMKSDVWFLSNAILGTFHILGPISHIQTALLQYAHFCIIYHRRPQKHEGVDACTTYYSVPWASSLESWPARDALKASTAS